MTILSRVKELWTLRKREIILIAFSVLVVLASFAWGYAIGRDGSRTPIIIETTA